MQWQSEMKSEIMQKEEEIKQDEEETVEMKEEDENIDEKRTKERSCKGEEEYGQGGRERDDDDNEVEVESKITRVFLSEPRSC